MLLKTGLFIPEHPLFSHSLLNVEEPHTSLFCILAVWCHFCSYKDHIFPRGLEGNIVEPPPPLILLLEMFGYMTHIFFSFIWVNVTVPLLNPLINDSPDSWITAQSLFSLLTCCVELGSGERRVNSSTATSAGVFSIRAKAWHASRAQRSSKTSRQNSARASRRRSSFLIAASDTSCLC